MIVDILPLLKVFHPRTPAALPQPVTMAALSLFSPIKVGNVLLKNRIGMAALTRNRAENTYPTDLMREYYVQRADAGLIISEAILVSRQGRVADSCTPRTLRY